MPLEARSRSDIPTARPAYSISARGKRRAVMGSAPLEAWEPRRASRGREWIRFDEHIQDSRS
jgi:hypothetical protein